MGRLDTDERRPRAAHLATPSGHGASARKPSVLPNVLLGLVFLLGLSIMLYPSVSNLYNQWRQDQLLTDYDEALQEMDESELEAAREAARAYNAALSPTFSDAFSDVEIPSDDEYWQLLDIAGNGVMGYVEIPKIEVRLPIYHGTGEEELEKGTGHLYGTSLPVGGEGTHSVISGHRGLPSALLFTDLDQLEVGDKFALHVLGETLAYEVDQVLVVEPTDVSSLVPEQGQDYVTLVTCTPYGVNTQRLLVRGHRVDSMGDAGEVTTAGQVLKSFAWWQLAVALGVLAVGIGACAVAVCKRREERRHRENE